MSQEKDIYILGIESSCDETAAAVVKNGREVLSNIISSQIVIHRKFGGVVPEIASRKHIENIMPVIDAALRDANVPLEQIDAVAVTYGPGLVGALLVGLSAAKSLAWATGKPLIGVNHLEGHVFANFLADEELEPPFMALVVSGGHTALLKVTGYNSFELLGQTRDDAAGEAFDKIARVMGLPYPGGPFIDRLAAEGDAKRFRFSKPHIAGLDYSFSGLKTSFLYTLRDAKAENPNFIEENKADLAASLQKTIIDILMDKFSKAVKQTGIKTIAIGGGVSANSGVRNAVQQYADCHHLKAFIPKRLFTTDNAAMVAVAGYFQYLNKDFCDI